MIMMMRKYYREKVGLYIRRSLLGKERLRSRAKKDRYEIWCDVIKLGCLISATHHLRPRPGPSAPPSTRASCRGPQSGGYIESLMCKYLARHRQSIQKKGQ